MWSELPVVVTFESDWEAAEKIILAIGMDDYESKKDRLLHAIEQVRREKMLEYRFLTPKVYVTILDSGVELSLRHLGLVKQRRATADILFREILKAFAKEPTIDLAYPTTRFYTSPKE